MSLASKFQRASLSRREIIRVGSLGLLGLTWPDLLRERAHAQATSPIVRPASSFGRAKSCILLYMWGGPAHQDTWDMKPAAPAEYRGEFRPISTNVPGIQVCEHFPQLARQIDKLAIVRSMTHGNADHLAASHYMLTGHAPPAEVQRMAESPCIGAVLAKVRPPENPLPPFVSLRPQVPGDVPRFVEETRGQFAGWLGPLYDPFIIDQNPSAADYKVGDFAPNPAISSARRDDRKRLLAELDRKQWPDLATLAGDEHRKRAWSLLDTALGAAAFDLSKEPLHTRERYGLNPHGQSVLQARRLIERGVPLVTVFWPNDGTKNVSVYWDTHSRNFVDLKDRLMPPADQAFSALLDDLAASGRLDETLIVWTGEFGRTPRVGQKSSDGAGADGRDHWPGCFTSVMAGGGIRGGQVYGASDRMAAYPAENPVAPIDLIATAYHCLGIDQKQVLADVAGRPQFVRPGQKIDALVG